MQQGQKGGFFVTKTEDVIEIVYVSGETEPCALLYSHQPRTDSIDLRNCSCTFVTVNEQHRQYFGKLDIA